MNNKIERLRKDYELMEQAFEEYKRKVFSGKEKQMELAIKEFKKDFGWFFILPTITVTKDDPNWGGKNLQIAAHFLGFHGRLFYAEREEKHELES